ncbi:MAG: FAD-dependent oxidoreductase, partial [Phycisphaera sp.]|nr:FAD-dependent oxidoreductase [Phycisphaera sp.]
MPVPNRRDFMLAAAATGAMPLLATAGGDDVSDLHIDFDQLRIRDYKALQKQLVDGGSMFRPETTGYAEVAAIQTSNLQVNPPVVVRPRTASEISRVLEWCRARSIFPRVRSGGHSYGGYSTADTLVLDLRDMKEVVSQADGIAQVGAGATLGEVARRLHCDGDLRLPSGSCPSVGISGLTLVGGHGAMTNRWGLTLDRLVAAEIVLADGSIVICSDRSDSDLFWALRGGGSGSYGVVTRLWYDAIPWATSWQAIVRWNWNAFPNAYPAWRSWIDTLPEETSALISFKSSATGGQVIVVMSDETSESTVTGQLNSLIDAIPDRLVQSPSIQAISTPACQGSDVLNPAQ